MRGFPTRFTKTSSVPAPSPRATDWALSQLYPEFAQAVQTDTTPNPDSYPVDDRGVCYFFAFFSAKHLGNWPVLPHDDQRQAKDSRSDGSSNYRLNVAANAPVTLYWSATAYDRNTHALIRNMPWPSRSSNSTGLQKNADGSVDIYFGPKAPSGKESNSIPTDPKGKFEVLFRLYGPQKPLFDKTWKLPDIEKTN